MRNLRRQSNTLIVPLTALAAIGWGVAFFVNAKVGRQPAGFRTTLAWMPYWCWSAMFVGAGVLLLWRLSDWTVALLVFVLGLYATTLATNIVITDTASLTGPIWPALVIADLVIAAHRVGVRRRDPE